MIDQEEGILLETSPNGSKTEIVVRFRGDRIHSDVINPAIASARQRFIKDLTEKVPALNKDMLDGELLAIADKTGKSTCQEVEAMPELDLSHFVRPEQFFTAEVSGITVSVARIVDGRPEARWMFCLRWRDGRREYRELSNCIDLPDGKRLWVHPIPGEPTLIAASAWSTPARRAWLQGAKPPDPANLFKRLCECIASFIDLPQATAAGTTATVALWSILTYCFQAWSAVPYLYIGGPQSSGKTRLFEVLTRLVYRGFQSSNLTAPALFRTVNDRGGTLLFDEAERLRQSTPDVQEILSMLLAGYKRGGQATRLEFVGESFRTITFDVYCPKALACITGLPPTLASRSIPILMFRAAPDSVKPHQRIDAAPDLWQNLRDDLHSQALEYGHAWHTLAQRTDVCPKGIGGRAYELWQPLLSLAAWIQSFGADGLLPLVQDFALNSIDGAKDDQIPDADETLLEVLVDGVRKSRWMTPKEILDESKERDHSTFEKWGPRTVSNRLKTYGIKAKKIDRRREYRDISLADLARIQQSYGIDLGISAPIHPETSSLTSRSVP